MSNRIFFSRTQNFRTDYKLLFNWFKYGNFLAITPFKNTLLKPKKIKKKYPIILSVVYFLILIYVGGDKYSIYYKIYSQGNQVVDKATLDGSEMAMEFFLIQQVLARCYFGRKNWETLLNTVIYLENKFTRYPSYLENDVNIWNIRLGLILFHLLFLFVHGFDHWANWGIITDLTAYLIYRISTYYVLYTAVFVQFIGTWLKTRYIFLQTSLKDFVTMSDNMIIFEESQKIKLVEKLKEFEHCYQKLHVICEECNTVFGWTQFFLMIVTVVGILSGCNYGLPTRKEVKEPKVIAINIIFPMIYVVSIFVIVLHFDKVEKIGMEIPKTCLLLYESSKSAELKDTLYSLAKYTNGLRPTFCAAGFWIVNRNVLSALFTSILTYLIVIIQAHMSVK